MVPCYHMITPFRTRRAKAARKAKAWERDEGTGRSPSRHPRPAPECAFFTCLLRPDRCATILLAEHGRFCIIRASRRELLTPHGSRIASAVWVYLWRSFPLRVRSALLITRNSSMTRVANSKSKIANEAIPKTVMVFTSILLE